MRGRPELEVHDQVAKELFVEWVADAMQEAAWGGAILIEIRFGGGWANWPDLMPRFREAERRTRDIYPDFFAEAIISGVSPDRPNGKELLDACLVARNAGLSGIDFLSSPRASGSNGARWREIYSWAELAADVGLGVTIHAGEFSSGDISSALRVPGVTRIGHAVHAVASPELLHEMKAAGVTLECCLTSNVVLGAVRSLSDHPIRTFVDAGVPVTLNTDDPVHFGTSIKAEYELAAGLGFDESDLLQFTRNGISASFTSEERKAALWSRVGRHEARSDFNRVPAS